MKLVHLFGFIIKKFVTMVGHMNVKVKRECYMVRVVTEILDSVSGGRSAVNRTPTQQADMPP